MAFAAGSMHIAMCGPTKHFGDKRRGVACGDQAQIRVHGSMQRTAAATAAAAVCCISLLCLALRRIYIGQEHIVVEQEYKKSSTGCL